MGRPNDSEILFSVVLTTIDLSRLIKIQLFKKLIKTQDSPGGLQSMG